MIDNVVIDIISMSYWQVKIKSKLYVLFAFRVIAINLIVETQILKTHTDVQKLLITGQCTRHTFHGSVHTSHVSRVSAYVTWFTGQWTRATAFELTFRQCEIVYQQKTTWEFCQRLDRIVYKYCLVGVKTWFFSYIKIINLTTAAN